MQNKWTAGFIAFDNRYIEVEQETHRILEDLSFNRATSAELLLL